VTWSPVSSTPNLVSGNLPFAMTNQLIPLVFTALGDPTRRAIVERLLEHPHSVGELALGMPVSRPAVSQHLRVLKEAGLVRQEAVGTRRIYRLDTAGAEALREYLERFWVAALGSFRDYVEQENRRRENES
jgi:DNA-binding transcriptional ArsR family regulator